MPVHNAKGFKVIWVVPMQLKCNQEVSRNFKGSTHGKFKVPV